MKKTSGMQNQEGDTGEENFQDEKMKLEAAETAEAVFQKQPWQNKDSDDLRGACSWKPGGSKTGWSYGETERAKTCRKCKGQPGSTRLFFRPQQLKVIWERQMSTAAINTKKEKEQSVRLMLLQMLQEGIDSRYKQTSHKQKDNWRSPSAQQRPWHTWAGPRNHRHHGVASETRVSKAHIFMYLPLMLCFSSRPVHRSLWCREQLWLAVF